VTYTKLKEISQGSLLVNTTIPHNFRIFDVLKKIISISLALILLVSNVGFTLGTHVCGGFAVISELMIGHNNLDCGMSSMDTETEVGAEPDADIHFESTPCCENDFQTLQTDNNFNSEVNNFNLNQTFVIAFVHTLLDNTLYPETPLSDYSNYSPPIPENDVQSLFQTFLI
jgi:hypothetical protein